MIDYFVKRWQLDLAFWHDYGGLTLLIVMLFVIFIAWARKR